MDQTHCSVCKITWEGEEIPLALFATGNYTSIEAAEEAAESYGWTPEDKRKFGINYTGFEHDGYDGVSEWHCVCGAKFDRFTGELL